VEDTLVKQLTNRQFQGELYLLNNNLIYLESFVCV